MRSPWRLSKLVGQLSRMNSYGKRKTCRWLNSTSSHRSWRVTAVGRTCAADKKSVQTRC